MSKDKIKYKLVQCKKCKRIKTVHAWGLCEKCYSKKQHKKYYEEHKEEILAYKRNAYHNNINKKIRIKHKNGNYPYLVYSGGKAVHRVIAEKALGRRLKKNEYVHHINGNAFDNRNCNLLICSNEYHTWLHRNIYDKLENLNE